MKILFLIAYFTPDQTGYVHLARELVEVLAQKGNEVSIVCPTPTRCDQAAIQEYKNKKTEEMYDGRVHITRFWAPQEGKNPILRAFRYFWCSFRTYQIGKKHKECDLVFSNSTPPNQGLLAAKVARKLKVPSVYSLQDIFPDSLVTTGLGHEDSLVWKIGRKMEDRTYALTDKIIVITDAMKENLLKKRAKAEKIEIVSNWIDTDQIKPVKREQNRLFDELSIDRSKYIVLYAGNFGLAQGAEIIFDVAEKLREEKDILFVIFGGGVGFEAAVERAKNLENVFIHPFMPLDRIDEVYSMGDTALVICKKGVGTSGMPSKTWSTMACGVPIVASFDLDSEMHKMLKLTKAGICVEPENVDALADAVMTMKKDGNSTDIRSEVIKIASKEACVSKYLQIFHEALQKS